MNYFGSERFVRANLAHVSYDGGSSKLQNMVLGGWYNSAAHRVLVLHAANMSLVPGILYDSPKTNSSDS